MREIYISDLLDLGRIDQVHHRHCGEVGAHGR